MEPQSPLESFVRDYVTEFGGAWEEVEPQVYDLLLPDGGDGLVRVAFDPEALPEHPGAQLASFGTPLIDRILADAERRGRYAEAYVIGLNLSPHDLQSRARRGLTLGKDLSVRVERARAMHFGQGVFWFRGTFVSDQKEQEIVPVGVDLHQGREVRHLDQLLEPSRLAEEPGEYLPEARAMSLSAAAVLARQQVLRSLIPLANTRRRDVEEHVGRQIERMRKYYADLREEVHELARRSGADRAKLAAREQGLESEERLRIAELKQKSTLRVQLSLLRVLLLWQPKLLLRTVVSSEEKSQPLEVVWDPLTEAIEAPACPRCARPTLALEMTRQGLLMCPACAAKPVTGARPWRG